MKKIIYWDDPQTIPTIMHELSLNRVVAASSDTVMGLLAPLTQQGFNALNEIKGRTNKPYLILVHDSLKSFLFSDAGTREPVKTLARVCWPGPLTLVVPALKTVPTFMTSGSGTVALRVPIHEGSQKLLRQCDGLFSTSANLTGHPVPISIEDLDPAIREAVSCIVIDRGRSLTNMPSTILDCTSERIRVIREGAFSLRQIRDILPASIPIEQD